MFSQAIVQKLFRSIALPLMAVIIVLQPVGVSAASAYIYGYHDYAYARWTEFHTPRLGSGAQLKFDQWSGNPMNIGYQRCDTDVPVSWTYSSTSGWALIGYPSGWFCLSTRPAPGYPHGSGYPFDGEIQY